jgi:hypothetical protein
MRPESWIAEDGSKRCRIAFVATQAEPTPKNDMPKE